MAGSLLSLFFSLPFCVCLVWSVIFLKEYRTADPAKRLLTGFMLVCTALYFAHAVYFSHNIRLFSLIESMYAFCTLAVYPLYYLYIRKLTEIKPFRIRDYWVLIPALFVGLVSCVLYLLMGDERLYFSENFFYQNATLLTTHSVIIKAQYFRLLFMKVVFAVQLVLVCYYGSKKLVTFNQQIDNFYANTEGKTLSPIRSLLMTFIIFSLLSTIANFLGRYFFIQKAWMVIIPSVVFSALIFSVAYLGFKQKFTAVDFFHDEQKETDRQEPLLSTVSGIADDPEVKLDIHGISDLKHNPLGKTIHLLMEEQQVFRGKELKITHIAKMSGSNRTYVSNYLNKELKLSFTDFVNRYRVEYVKSLLTATDRIYSTTEIFEMAGFTTEVSFYRIFKKHTGLTPRQWKEQHCGGASVKNQFFIN